MARTLTCALTLPQQSVKQVRGDVSPYRCPQLSSDHRLGTNLEGAGEEGAAGAPRGAGGGDRQDPGRTKEDANVTVPACV